MLVPTFNLDQAIADEDESEGEDEGTAVTLKESYISHGASDDGIEEQSADVMVAREVEKRGAQEG